MTALERADLVVVVTTAEVRACAASALVARAVRTTNPNVGVVVRGPAPSGLRAPEVAEIVGVPLIAAMRPEPNLASRLDNGGLRLSRRSPLAAPRSPCCRWCRRMGRRRRHDRIIDRSGT